MSFNNGQTSFMIKWIQNISVYQTYSVSLILVKITFNVFGINLKIKLIMTICISYVYHMYILKHIFNMWGYSWINKIFY